MKRTALRIVAVCLVAVAMMAIAGCEKDEDLAKFVTETQSVPSGDCRFEITVTTTGGGWRVSKCPDWIDLSPERGKEGSTTVTVSVEANPDTKQRRGYVRFSFGDVLEVVQSGK